MRVKIIHWLFTWACHILDIKFILSMSDGHDCMVEIWGTNHQQIIILRNKLDIAIRDFII